MSEVSLPKANKSIPMDFKSESKASKLFAGTRGSGNADAKRCIGIGKPFSLNARVNSKLINEPKLCPKKANGKSISDCKFSIS